MLFNFHIGIWGKIIIWMLTFWFRHGPLITNSPRNQFADSYTGLAVYENVSIRRQYITCILFKNNFFGTDHKICKLNFHTTVTINVLNNIMLWNLNNVIAWWESGHCKVYIRTMLSVVLKITSILILSGNFIT